MLYLAEVQRKARVIGGGKAEFKLLACQRSEQSWSAVPGEEIIPAPDDATYNAGALVLLELTASRQLQRHSEAGRQLVSILQNFSRLQEKAKTQEEEIEQWKQSLTYQSQELNRREMEMEARQEQLQQMEEDFEKLEQQRQEVEAARDEVTRLREEFERKSQELEGAWAHLHGEMSRLEERQAELQQSAVLDEGQARHIQELLGRLSGAVAPTEAVREQLNASFEVIAQQQGVFDQYWQHLEAHQASASQLQEEVDRQVQEIQQRWQEWQQAQQALEQARSDLKAQETTLALKQSYADALAVQLQSYDDLHQVAYSLADGSDGVKLGTKIDIEALEAMPLDELGNLVRDLEKDLEKMSRFVNGQEEELTLQQEAIDELKQQIQQASEYDRLRMETELADEQDRYQMLNETLVGQRRTLQERDVVLKRHQSILARRQGHGTKDESSSIDLSPILAQIDEMRQRQSQELNELREQVQQLRGAIDQTQGTVEQQAGEQGDRWNELRRFEDEVQSRKASVAELWAKVNTYRETLQPLQDGLNGLRQNLETIGSVMNQFQEASDYQLQAIAEMQQTVQRLTGNQSLEFVIS